MVDMFVEAFASKEHSTAQHWSAMVAQSPQTAKMPAFAAFTPIHAVYDGCATITTTKEYP
jgi:hypothetical protein